MNVILSRLPAIVPQVDAICNLPYFSADMAWHLIIDGYNLLGVRGGTLGSSGWYSESARESLIQELSRYSQAKQHRITVVFDAWRAGMGVEQREHRTGVQVVYSRQGETADTVIQRLVRQFGADCAVVSSDHDIIMTATSHGALVMKSEEFQAKLASSSGRSHGRGYPPLYDKTRDARDDLRMPRPEKKGNPRKLPKSQRVRNRKFKKF